MPEAGAGGKAKDALGTKAEQQAPEASTITRPNGWMKSGAISTKMQPLRA